MVVVVVVVCGMSDCRCRGGQVNVIVGVVVVIGGGGGRNGGMAWWCVR
jgi:hypothetical protein